MGVIIFKRVGAQDQWSNGGGKLREVGTRDAKRDSHSSSGQEPRYAWAPTS